MTSDSATDPPPDEDPNEGTSRGNTCAWDNADCAGTPLCPPRCPRFFDRTETPLLIRPPRDDEWAQLRTMYEDIETSTMALPPATPEKRRAWLSHLRETGWNLIALDDDQVVGHISVAPADDPVPEFVVFVHPEYHNRGIGTELVKQAIAHAADKDHEALALAVEPANQRAISVYTNVGFDIVDRGLGIRMQLELADPIAHQVQLPPGDRPDDH